MVDVKVKKPSASVLNQGGSILGALDDLPKGGEEKKEPNIWTLVETKKKDEGADNTG